ncbi:hypothetical protein [Rubritalea tangerina]
MMGWRGVVRENVFLLGEVAVKVISGEMFFQASQVLTTHDRCVEFFHLD